MSVAKSDTADRAPGPVRLALMWQSSVGKKALMAITGAILFVYVVAHLLGNLQIYIGAQKIDDYAKFLHSSVGLLWTARVILLIAVLTHALAGSILYVHKSAARPVGYRQYTSVQGSIPSRTMIWSGLAILLFVVFHVANLTLGAAVPGYQEIRPSVNVPAAFHVVWASAIYIAAMLGLGMHLWHGLYSMWQSIGLRHPRYAPGLKATAATVATLVALGNISIPIAVLAGVIK